MLTLLQALKQVDTRGGATDSLIANQNAPGIRSAGGVFLITPIIYHAFPMPQVALFITCLTDQFYPHVGIAITKILERFGCEVRFPATQTCCGQPFFNNGFHSEARELATRMIEIFRALSLCGHSLRVVLRHGPRAISRTSARRSSLAKTACRPFARKTYEFVEFLDKVLKVDFRQFSLPRRADIAYHYTCHLRGIGVKDEGVRLLRQIGNVQFKPMEKTDQCCGFGGTFAIKYPAISGAIVDDKVNCIQATGAKTLVCNDAGCTMNISGMCHRRGMETSVKHIAELMAEAMGIDTGAW